MTFLTVKYHDWQSAPMICQQKKFIALQKFYIFSLQKRLFGLLHCTIFA